MGEGKTPKEIAAIKKYSAKHVRNLGLAYHRKGLEAFSVDGRRGGNNRIMSEEKSDKFLERFESMAKEGKMLTIEELAKELDKETGKERKSLSTAYSFLHRHGWRKVMPRSKHPDKASGEEIESSKKLTLESGK